MKTLVLSLAVVAATVLGAAEQQAKDAPKKISKKVLVTGGFMKVPGTQKGNITFVNSSATVKDEWLTEHTKYLRMFLDCDYRIRKSDLKGSDLASLIKFKESEKINLALFLIDDPANPAGLSAYPEQGIVVVNLLAITKGADGKFVEMRCKKEISRGVAYLCGGGSSQYPETVLGPVTKPEDIDLAFNNEIPFDAIQKFPKYLAAFGITPAQKTTYKKACQEGWAPAPTNDIQKAVWDKVHALPTEPIKIKPETKKVTD